MFRSRLHRHRVARVTAAASLVTALVLGSAAAAGAAVSEPDQTIEQASSRSADSTRLTARTSTDLAVYARRGDAVPTTSLPATTAFGTTRVLLVTKRQGAWLRVLLPARPNGSSGWVRGRDVELRPVHDEVDVDLTSRLLTWRRNGAVMLQTPVAVGAPETPTPAGHFYVTDLLDTPDGGAYGPFAIGLSAHSDTLSEFGGGDGQIGLHGTSDPSSIGQSVSHGCVRVPNEVVVQLATNLPLGTPVTLH